MPSSIPNSDNAPPAQTTTRTTSPLVFESSSPPFDYEHERAPDESASTGSTEHRESMEHEAAASMGIAEPNSSDRGTVEVATSARKTKYTSKKSGGSAEAKRQPSRQKKNAIGKHKRVFIERRVVRLCLDVNSPAYKVVQEYQSDKFRFYGSVMGKAPDSRLHRIKLDLLPSDNNEILVGRNSITVLALGDEEPAYDPRRQEEEEKIEECSEILKPKSRETASDFFNQSYKSFAAMPPEVQAASSSFQLKYGKGDDDRIDWKILSRTEQITVCPMEESNATTKSPNGLSTVANDEETSPDSPSFQTSPNSPSSPEANSLQATTSPMATSPVVAMQNPFHDELPWSKDPNEVDYNILLLTKFFPSVEGKAKVLDEFLRRVSTNPMQPNHFKSRVERDNIKFERPDHDDPDVLLKICLTLMVTAVLEVEKGVEGLWKRGKSGGMKEYPNYGQYIPQEYFRAFLHGLTCYRS